LNRGSHWPDPPCADALIAAGLRRVIVALEDPDARVAAWHRKLAKAGLRRTRIVRGGSR